MAEKKRAQHESRAAYRSSELEAFSNPTTSQQARVSSNDEVPPSIIYSGCSYYCIPHFETLEVCADPYFWVVCVCGIC
jgi:hypothetical protein